MSVPLPLWIPPAERAARSNLAAFAKQINVKYSIKTNSYDNIHAWSCTYREAFWQEIWNYCNVIGGNDGATTLIDRELMPGARWFPGAKLNFAENLLRKRDDTTALVFWGEDQVKSSVTWAELYAEVSRLAQALRAAGITRGDRVAAYLPNLPGAVIGMLAATSIGAVWSS